MEVSPFWRKIYEAASLPHIFFALLARFLPRAVTGLSEIVTLTRFVAAATKRPLSAFAIPSFGNELPLSLRYTAFRSLRSGHKHH